MKLRQKLAMVLATAMVVTAVPVVTMAATTNRVTNVASVTKNTEFSKVDAPELVLKLEDNVTTNATFYVTVENAEFVKTKDDKGYTVDGTVKVGNKEVTVKAVSKTELEVTMPGTLLKNEEIRIPMATKLKEGEAKVTVEGTKFITGGTYAFASTQSGSVAVRIGEVSSFYTDGGELASIELTENVAGAFAAKAKTREGKEVVEIRLELDNTDFKIVKNKLVVKAERGFGSKTITPADMIFDKDEVTIYLNKADVTGFEKGRVKLSGIEVATDKKAPATGDLNLTIISDITEQKEYKVATIAEYGSKLTVKDDKVVGITAGRDEKVTFTLKQVVKDSMVAGRTVEFTIDGGHIFGDTIAMPEGLELKTVAFKDDDAKTKLITGFTATVKEVKDKYEFKDVKVVGTLGNAGDITLKAEGRALGQELKTVIAKVNASVKVETQAAKLEVGVREQKGGKITITETDKDMVKKGNIVIALEKENGLSFTGEPEVKVVSGDIKLGKSKLDKVAGTLTIPVTRTSREVSTIEIVNFPVKIDRTVPNGGYDIEIAGTALSTEYKTLDKEKKEVVKNFGKQKVENFFIVGEGIGTKIVTTITNSATEIVVNGVKTTLEAPAFLEKGKMMVPLRAVAEAFGIPSKDIVYSAGNIAIFANGRAISLTIGSKDAFVNGAKMTLANPAKIVNKRTTVPVGDLGRLLGLKVEWNNATKTATFSN